MICPPEYDEIGEFSENMLPIKINEKWVYMDESGNIVIKPEFESVEKFLFGKAVV